MGMKFKLRIMYMVCILTLLGNGNSVSASIQWNILKSDSLVFNGDARTLVRKLNEVGVLRKESVEILTTSIPKT